MSPAALASGLEKAEKKQAIKNGIILAAALIIAFLAFAVPIDEEAAKVSDTILNHEARIALGVLLFALILWMTEAVPFHITGLLAVFLLALFRVDSFKSILREGFGNHIVVFFIGVLILSAFITHSGLGKRISGLILSLTGSSSRMVIFGFLITGMTLSMWLTNMAVAAMLLPLGKAILEEEGVAPLKSNFGKALMISICWGSIIGGIATPAGAGPNPLAIGFLKEMAGIDMNFLDWMKFGVPAAFLLLFPVWGLLLLFFPPEIKKLKKTKEELRREFKEMPPMSREEKITLAIFLLTVALWICSPLLELLLGIAIPISMPVMVTACLFFIPGLTTTPWKKVERDISWSGILLVLTGISLGMKLYSTGAAKWLSVIFLGNIGSIHPFFQVFLVILIVSFLKIAFSSNTVTATIIIPIMIALAQSNGLEPLTITLPAALTTSMAFILVTSSPTNVIPYSAGYFSIKDMAIAGAVVTVVASIIVAAVIFSVGTISGLY